MKITNPFKQKPPVDKPNRNAFDLSHAVNFTAKFGKLYPIMCKEVVPGDSFNIKSVMGLRLMPLAFPVQSRMRADIHFFYVRSRNLWDDWQDFITASKDNLTPPYIQRAAGQGQDIFGTGTLGDYLGVPTTVANSLTDVYQSPMSSIRSLKYYENDYSEDVDIPQNVGNDAVGWLRSKAWTTLTESMFVLKMSSINVLQNRPVGGVS